MKISIAGLMLLVTAVAVSASAKKVTKKQTESQIPVAAAFDVESPILDSEYYKKEMKESEERGKRNVAQTVNDIPAIEMKFSNDFLNLRSELIGGPTYVGSAPQAETIPGVKTPEELDRLIDKYSEPVTYSKLSTQAQFVVLQLRGLKPFKSFIYRAQEYVGRHTAVRSAIVTMLRNSAAGLQAYFPVTGSPVNQWDIVYRYITEPMPGMEPAINQDMDLYSFLTRLNVTTYALVSDMAKIYNKKEAIWWDNKLYMSFANFTSEKDRYVKLGSPELATILASGYMSLSGLNSLTAYSIDGLQEAIRQTGNFFGIDVVGSTLKGKPVSGLTAQDRFDALKSQPNLFVITRDGEQRMKASYSSLVIATRLARTAWQELKQNTKREDEFLFDPRVVIPFNRVLGTSFEHVDELFAGKGAHSTVVNGEVVKVNLELFYNQPPRSLRELYPQKFDESAGWLKKDVNGQKVTYRNYKSGSAIGWNLEAYSKYFPEAKPMQGQPHLTNDVPKFARVLSQTWGGAALGLPLTSFIF